MGRIGSQPRNRWDALERLAEAVGVQTSYTDGFNRRREATAAALMAALRALGWPIDRPEEAPDLLRQFERERSEAPIEPVILAWGSKRPRFELRLPEGTASAAPAGWIETEGGDRFEARLRVISKHRTAERAQTSTALRIDHELNFGVHWLVVEIGGQRIESCLIVAPERCHQGEGAGARDVGVFIPLYALASGRDDGVGDFGDLRAMSDWAGSQGVRFVGSLPLLACFLDEPFEPSPYSPVSRLFWNELFVDLNTSPDLELARTARRLLESAEWRRESERLRRSPLVDYRGSMALKRRALDELADAAFANESRRNELERRLAADPHLHEYAAFRAAVERARSGWRDWATPRGPGELQEGRDYEAAAWRRHVYAQWLLSRQLEDLAKPVEPGSAARLYMDLPLGVNANGFDAWRWRELFAPASVGAPPDALFRGGQNWGFPPIQPEASRRQGHAYFRAAIRHHLQHAGMLRIDHVMGLHRLFWIPDGVDPTDGLYVHYPADELYAIVCIESQRARARVVGENLGTVPDEVNRTMKRRGLLTMDVAPFAFKPRADRAIPRPKVGSLACLNTHDMPPFPAFWSAEDINLRIRLGHLEVAGADRERRERRRLCKAIVAFLVQRGELREDEADEVDAVARAVLHELAASPADTLLVNLEDLWGETQPQNVPGTTDEHPNWRRRASRPLETITSDAELSNFLSSLVRRRLVTDSTGAAIDAVEASEGHDHAARRRSESTRLNQRRGGR